jgi:hypothetical protein
MQCSDISGNNDSCNAHHLNTNKRAVSLRNSKSPMQQGPQIEGITRQEIDVLIGRPKETYSTNAATQARIKPSALVFDTEAPAVPNASNER